MEQISKELAKHRILTQFKNSESCIRYLMINPGHVGQWLDSRYFKCSDFDMVIHVERIKNSKEFQILFLDSDEEWSGDDDCVDLSNIAETNLEDYYIERIDIHDKGVYFETKRCCIIHHDYKFELVLSEDTDALAYNIDLNVVDNKFTSQNFKRSAGLMDACRGLMKDDDGCYVPATPNKELLETAKKAKWVKELSKDNRRGFLSLLKDNYKTKNCWYMHLLIQNVDDLINDEPEMYYDGTSYYEVKESKGWVITP